jgi:hypothetical protein
MSIRTFACVVLALCSMSAGARADGVSVKKWIELKELVAKSDVIVTATILECRPEHAKREAYGESHEYVASFHFKVRVDAWLKGPRRDLPAWLSYRGDPLPGKWMLVEEGYRSSFSPHGAKPGQRVIAFLTGEATVDGDEVHARELDDIARLADVQKALGKSPKTAKQEQAPRPH